MSDVHLGLWAERESALRQAFEGWRRREDELERVMQTVPEATVERFASMSDGEVRRHAAAVEAMLAAVVREHGGGEDGRGVRGG